MTGEEIKLKRLSHALEEDMTENELFEIARERRYRINDLQKENAELKTQIKSTRMEKGILVAKLKSYEALWNEQQRTIKEKSAQIEKMECCHNCKNCEINFTNDSGIKYGCKKLRHKSDDCILNYYYHWELAE